MALPGWDEKLPPNGQCERGVAQFRIDMCGDMPVVPLGKPAPMQSRPHVVCRMEAVVEKEPVDPLSGNIPGVVVQGIMIASLVLEEIDGDYAPLAEDPGENTIQKRCAGIRSQQKKSQAQNSQAFPLPLSCQPRVPGGHTGKVAPLALAHLSDGGERKQKQIYPIPFVPNQSAPNTVFLRLVLSMVAVVMDGDHGDS